MMKKSYRESGTGSFHGGKSYSLRGTEQQKTEDKETAGAADTTAAKGR